MKLRINLFALVYPELYIQNLIIYHTVCHKVVRLRDMISYEWKRGSLFNSIKANRDSEA